MNTNENMSYYKFMRKQILVINALNVATAPGYLLIGYFYTDMLFEILWVIGCYMMAFYGYTLYNAFDKSMSIDAKRIWGRKTLIFMFSLSIIWSIMFFYYISFDNVEMHYVTIATQLGSAVVASTVLASQKKLFIYTVSALMLPLAIYFIYIQETYTYLLSFFTIIFCFVLLYAAQNTNDYISKSSYQAYHDHLTQLGNRRLFLEMLEGTVQQNNDKHAFLLLIDLDYFKTINDTLGHDVGDKLLREVAERIKLVSKKYSAIAGRLGGDEFAILSKSFKTKAHCDASAHIFAEEVLALIKQLYDIDSNHLYISASIGVSTIHAVDVEAAELLKEADMAMYEAKNNGRDGIIMFNKQLSDIVQNKLNIERLLYFALQNEEISLVYQPQVDSNEKIIGCEVLARWTNPTLGPVNTDIFIDIAEKTGYIIDIGEYILEEALKTLHEWNQKDINLQQFSINISMRQLFHQNFIHVVDKLFNKYNLNNIRTKIIFEITESTTSDDMISLVNIINELEKYNIFFSMDDFGTGYSSLSYLRDIPLYELKIDKSFIMQIADKKQASLIKTIIQISKNFDLNVVAEGVEEEYQKQFLHNLECDVFQGFLFSKPVTKIEFENIYAT